jgi:hypothetical protein
MERSNGAERFCCWPAVAFGLNPVILLAMNIKGDSERLGVSLE